MGNQVHNGRAGIDHQHPRQPPRYGWVVRLPEVMEITGVSRTTIWRRERERVVPSTDPFGRRTHPGGGLARTRHPRLDRRPRLRTHRRQRFTPDPVRRTEAPAKQLRLGVHTNQQRSQRCDHLIQRTLIPVHHKNGLPTPTCAFFSSPGSVHELCRWTSGSCLVSGRGSRIAIGR